MTASELRKLPGILCESRRQPAGEAGLASEIEIRISEIQLVDAKIQKLELRKRTFFSNCRSFFFVLDFDIRISNFRVRDR